MIEILSSTSAMEKEELEEMTDDELEELYNSLGTEDWLDELGREDEEGRYYLSREEEEGDYFESLDESKKSGVTASLKKKSKASGIPVGILRKVFSRGMQAWNAGHRPGVAQHQWGMGRVNSFITGSGGARKADSDLWTKAKAAKERKKKSKMNYLKKFNEDIVDFDDDDIVSSPRVIITAFEGSYKEEISYIESSHLKHLSDCKEICHLYDNFYQYKDAIFEIGGQGFNIRNIIKLKEHPHVFKEKIYNKIKELEEAMDKIKE